jgi:hypothetical protein
VRLKRHRDNVCARRTIAQRSHCFQNARVAAMDAIKIPDGHHRPRWKLSQTVDALENIHASAPEASLAAASTRR